MKLLLTSLKLVPLPEGVAIPMLPRHLNEDKTIFTANELHETSARSMLDELPKWATALQPLHKNQ